jgi:hypothetical protein
LIVNFEQNLLVDFVGRERKVRGAGLCVAVLGQSIDHSGGMVLSCIYSQLKE